MATSTRSASPRGGNNGDLYFWDNIVVAKGTPTGGLGINYCAANANSTGATGSISATGSDQVGLNNLTLTAGDLPTNSFGFFLTSQTQAQVANPGGSAGNLCLGGAIGRYVGPGQVLNSGATGAFSLALDLTNTPQPTGGVAVQAGRDLELHHLAPRRRRRHHHVQLHGRPRDHLQLIPRRA